MRPVELSIVIAVYNEEAVLEELERRLTAALRSIGRSYEIVLVDDGSRDRSLERLLSLRDKDPEHIRIFSFTRNFGHHIALTAGLDHAEGEIMVMMDADLQDQPEEIPKLLAKLDEGYEVVWGERERRQFKWYKNLSSYLFLWVMNTLARSEVRLDSSIFRAMRKNVADDLRAMREKARYLPGLVRWIGYRQASVPVVHGKRFAGETKYSFWRLIKLALSTATSFSAAPLQFATVSGMITAGVAVLAVIYILIRKILGAYSVPGYASIMIAIFFFGALQLIVIGLMGEYISRIYREAQGRPLYLLKDLSPRVSRSVVLDRVSDLPHRFSELSEPDRGEFLSALERDAALPMKFLNGDPGPYYFEQWQKSNPSVFLRRERDRLAAVCLLSELEWDTRVLGVPATRILYANAFGNTIDDRRIVGLRSVLHDAVEFARRKNIRLMDVRVPSEDLFIMRAFEQEGFHLVDVLVTLGAERSHFDRILDRPKVPFKDILIRPMRPGDETVLAKISETSYGDTSMIQDRFFLEPMIPHERGERLFVEWFVNIARRHHEGNATVLVAEFQGSPCGYLAMEPFPARNGEVWLRDSLNAVAAEARGQGLYRSLVIEAIRYARESGAPGIFTKTQSSTYRVINTWLHLGGAMLESAATLHWTNP